MEIDWMLIMKIVIISLIHWMLVPVALSSLAERQRVVGNTKKLWALTIIFFTCAGSLLFLIFHPRAISIEIIEAGR